MKKQFSILYSIMAFLVLVAFTPISESDGYYTIDSTSSSVVWTGQKITGSSHTGTVTIKEGELPVFWACGVTPQVAIEQAKPDFCITHSPGHMLITDLPNSRLAVL